MLFVISAVTTPVHVAGEGAGGVPPPPPPPPPGAAVSGGRTSLPSVQLAH